MSRIASLLVWVAALAAGACRPEAADPHASGAAAASQILEASSLPALLPKPIPSDPTHTTIHRLSNGMTVYLSSVRNEPRISALIAVRAGARHDPPEATGLAHYLEHMVLFKGSDELGTVDHEAERPHLDAIRALYRELPGAKTAAERKAVFAKIDRHTQAVARTSVPNEVMRLYESLGFTGTNAFTDLERTRYVTELPSNRIEQWATVEAERLADPVFRLFYPELEAVYEEKNRGLDDSWRQLHEATFAAAFPGHPYGTQTVLGKGAHLKTPAFDEMAAFFDRWYRPNNMAILLAGDVDESVLPILERAFARLEPADLGEIPSAVPAAPKGRVETTVSGSGDQAVRVVWRTVPDDHPDQATLQVIDRLLDDDLVGLLNVGLELSGKVPAVGSYSSGFREAGVFVAEALVRDDTTHDAVERLLRESVAELGKGATTSEQLRAVKVQIAADRMRRLETASARTARMLDAFTRMQDWREVVARADAIETVTLEDVKRVANTYFGDDFVVGRIVRGQDKLAKIPKPDVTPLKFADEATGPLARKLASAEVAPIEPRFVELGRDASAVETSWGRFVWSRNRRNDLFDLLLMFDEGMRQTPLLCHAMTVLERSGTTDKSAREFQVALYRLGASLQMSCDAEKSLVYLRGVDEHFDDAVALVAEMLRSPKFETALTAETVKTTLTNRRAQVDHDAAIFGALRGHAFFGSDGPTMQAPSNAQLRRAQPRALEKLVQALPTRKHTVAYYGPRDGASVAASLAFGDGRIDAARRHQRRYRTLAMNEVHVVHRASAQAQVSVVFPFPATARAAFAQVETAGAYLRRRSFDDVRGARALAYFVDAGVDVGNLGDDSALWGTLQTQPDKTLEAVPALLSVLRAPKVDAALFDGAVAQVREQLRSQRVDPHVVPLAVANWRYLGVDRDAGAMVWESLAQVSPDSVTELVTGAAKGPAFITIVGDTSRIDLDGLAGLGRVELHEAADLFPFGSFD